METLLALVIGILYGTGVYLLLRRNTLKFIIALGLISNATHLLIFTSAGLTRGAPPLIGDGATTLTPPYADPLPQALILTAIVISFGLTAFMILLVQRSHATLLTDDPAELVHTDHLEPHTRAGPQDQTTGTPDGPNDTAPASTAPTSPAPTSPAPAPTAPASTSPRDDTPLPDGATDPEAAP